MSEDRRSQSARDTAPEPPGGEDALRHVRWDKRLEAARARRAQVLSEKRARGEDEGQTLISRRPWEDEASGVLPTDLPQRAMPKAPPRADAKDGVPPVPPGSGVQASRPVAPPSAPVPGSKNLPDREQAPDRGPVAAGRPKRRVGLFAGFAVGGLVAAGALFVVTGWMPPPATLPESAPVGTPDAVAETVAAPLPDAGLEPGSATVAEGLETPELVPGIMSEDEGSQSTSSDLAGAMGSGPVVALPEEAEFEVATEPAPEPIPDPVPDTLTDLAAAQVVDVAALSAIALPEAPVAEASDIALASGAIGGDARAPRSPVPPPLMSPADPVLAGLGVRAQRQSPAMPASAAVIGGATPVSALAPRAVSRPLPSTAAPRLALPEGPDRPVAGENAAPAAVLATVAAPAVPDAAPAAQDAAPRVLQAPSDAVLSLAVAAPPGAPPPEGAIPGIDLTPPAPPLPAVPPQVVSVAIPPTETGPEVLPEVLPEVTPAVLPESESPVAAAEEIAPVDEVVAPEKPEAPVPAPPRAEAVLVHMLVPADGTAQTAAAMSEAVAALGYTRRDPAPVSVTIRQTQVRYYHPEDAEAAQLVAGTVGGPARDFTAFRPSPPEGTIEVWVEGEAPPSSAPVRAPAPVEVQAAPPPPPQPQGFCFRGEPGSPGALRVPIVDGRCAWP